MIENIYTYKVYNDSTSVRCSQKYKSFEEAQEAAFDSLIYSCYGAGHIDIYKNGKIIYSLDKICQGDKPTENWWNERDLPYLA